MPPDTIEIRPAGREVGDELLTPEEVAERLRVSRPTVYAWLKMGRLRGLRAGKAWRIRPDDLSAFLQPDGTPETTAEQAIRKYSREEILEFLEADQLDPETRRKVESLLAQ
jgi:excisionase family DNA binding protein